jgi:hypothetical protein
MFCPKCASQAVEGQRFCRNCGTNLGAIVDAMEGKRGPLDFDSLKEDLRQLGSSLRAGFEEARQNLKKTQRLSHSATAGEAATPQIKVWGWKTGEEEKPRYPAKPAAAQVKVKEKHRPRPRKYSLQQAMLSIFSGSAMSAALYYLLNTAAGSGLLGSLERVLLRQDPDFSDVTGLAQVVQALWIVGLIPVAKGVAHLINGIFFAPKPAGEAADEPPVPAPGFIPQPPSYARIGGSPATNEFERKVSGDRPSITEDPTEQFAPPKAVTSDQ